MEVKTNYTAGALRENRFFLNLTLKITTDINPNHKSIKWLPTAGWVQEQQQQQHSLK